MNDKVKHVEEVELIYGYELEKEEQQEEASIGLDDYETELYFRYRGCLYGLYQFMRLADSEWHGSMTLTNTSGLVIKLDDTQEFATVGMVY